MCDDRQAIRVARVHDRQIHSLAECHLLLGTLGEQDRKTEYSGWRIACPCLRGRMSIDNLDILDETVFIRRRWTVEL